MLWSAKSEPAGLIPVGFILLFILLSAGLAGCSFSVGGGPQKKPELTPIEIRRNVKNEMKSPETKELIRQAAMTQKLELLLETPEADKLIQEEIIKSFNSPDVSLKLQENMKKILEVPEVREKLADQVTKALDTPEVKKALDTAVKNAVMSLLQGGGQGGGQSAGQSAGQSGQSGSGGGGGGGGGDGGS